jgi:putative ABC transport system permease protein
LLKIIGGQLRHAGWRAFTLASAVLVAALSFVLLTSAATTAEVRVRGSVEGAFRPAYDILVRPEGTFSTLEQREGLVRANYLGGLFGGITRNQYKAITDIPAVEVAAPIANLGYIIAVAEVRLPLDHLLNDDPAQLYRVREIFIANGGLSRNQGWVGYVYYTRQNPFAPGAREILPDGRTLALREEFYLGIPYHEHPIRPPYLLAFSALAPGAGSDANDPRYPYGRVTASALVTFPMLAAAIDPEQEAQLLDLDRTVVSGRYFRPHEASRVLPFGDGSFRATFAPAIASTRTYVDEELVAEVERLRIGDPAAVPTRLASRDGYRWVSSLPGSVVDRIAIGPRAAYERALERGTKRGTGAGSYWVPSDVRYRNTAPPLTPREVRNSLEIWRNPQFATTGYFYAPPSSFDIHFRKIDAYIGTHLTSGTTHQRPSFRIVGRYDPEKLPGFNPLSRVPLETYYPPLMQPANDASRKALGGRPLLPTQNIGDYIQQPPLVLTTLDAVEPFLHPKAYKGPTDRRLAPISSIRIRVAGVSGPDELSMARIRSVALEIRERTGLDVDITAGSSPRELLIDLPPGKFGRPRLLLDEGWVKKGVSVAFLRAVDEKTFALGGLILVAAAFFVANGAFAAVRSRRRELGTLVCVGWSSAAIFALVLAELAVLGLAAGITGAAVAIALTLAFDLDLSWVRALLAVPLAVLLALAAGLVPAWLAARSTPLDAVLPLTRGEARGRRVRGLPSLAAANLRRMRGRTLVGVAGLAAAVATLTVLVAINAAFEGNLVGTLLGDAIIVRVSGLDYLSVAIAILLAVLAVADVLYLNLRERAAELLTLATSGWSDRELIAAAGLEALGLGLIGAVAGAVIGVMAGVIIDLPLAWLLIAGFASAAGGVALALVASVAPLRRVTRLAPTTVLADE